MEVHYGPKYYSATGSPVTEDEWASWAAKIPKEFNAQVHRHGGSVGYITLQYLR
jgi:hypothetical protein